MLFAGLAEFTDALAGLGAIPSHRAPPKSDTGSWLVLPLTGLQNLQGAALFWRGHATRTEIFRQLICINVCASEKQTMPVRCPLGVAH
jgi:hypothetical protein